MIFNKFVTNDISKTFSESRELLVKNHTWRKYKNLKKINKKLISPPIVKN